MGRDVMHVGSRVCRKGKDKTLGTIKEAVDKAKWIVKFDDDKEAQLSSNQLIKIKMPGATVNKFNGTVESSIVPISVQRPSDQPSAEPSDSIEIVLNGTVESRKVASVQRPSDQPSDQPSDYIEVGYGGNSPDRNVVFGQGLLPEYSSDEEDNTDPFVENPDCYESEAVQIVAANFDLLEPSEDIDNPDMQDDIAEVEELLDPPDVHEERQRKYEREKAKLIEEGKTMVKKRGNIQVVWKVVDDKALEQSYLKENDEVGLKDFDFRDFDNKPHPYADLFIKLYPSDNYKLNLRQLNDAITAYNNKLFLRKRIPLVSEKEWWTFHGIVIAAAQLHIGGQGLFETKAMNSLAPPPNMGRYMTHNRFKEIKQHFPAAFYDNINQHRDPWYKISAVVHAFNQNRSKNVAASAKKVMDESMCAFRPRTTALGGLPNISYIKRKPEPLGTEFKTVACCATKCMLHLEIQRGMQPMREAEFSAQHGVTTACSLRLVIATTSCGQDNPERSLYGGDSWFGSLKTAELIFLSGNEFMGVVKTAHSGYPLAELEQTMSDWPAGSNLVLETLTTAGVKVFAVGYKYRKAITLSFVMTENAGLFVDGLAYASKFNDKYGNVVNRKVPRPACVSSYFLGSGIIDTHNQVRQPELMLEKHWVVKMPWFRLLTTIIFGMGCTDAWNLARYGVAGSNKKILNMTSTTFAGHIAHDLLHYPCSDEVYPAIYIPTVPKSPVSHVEFCLQEFRKVIDACNTPYRTAARPKNASHMFCISVPNDAPYVPDSFRQHHLRQVINPKKNSKAKIIRQTRRSCKDPMCKSMGHFKSRFMCGQCGQVFCFMETDDCRMCFYAHICDQYVKSLAKGSTARKQFQLKLEKWNDDRKQNFLQVKDEDEDNKDDDSDDADDEEDD